MDVLSSPIELEKTDIDGRFRLINIVSQRAKELVGDSKPKIQTKSKKVTTIAIEEAVAETLEYITGEEAKQANENARKMDYKRFLEEKKRATEQEDLSELEKDLKFYLNEKDDPQKSQIDDLFVITGEAGETSEERTRRESEVIESAMKEYTDEETSDDSEDSDYRNDFDNSEDSENSSSESETFEEETSNPASFEESATEESNYGAFDSEVSEDRNDMEAEGETD